MNSYSINSLKFKLQDHNHKSLLTKILEVIIFLQNLLKFDKKNLY